MVLIYHIIDTDDCFQYIILLHRQIRLRKEYIYRKSLVGAEHDEYIKKKKIADALNSGQPIPNELRKDASAILESMEYDRNLEEPMPALSKSDRFFKLNNELAMDAEYTVNSKQLPKVLITTSVDPSNKLISFVKELKLIIPNSVRINRGKHSINQFVSACQEHNASDIIIIHETRGKPDNLIVSHLPYGPTAYFTIYNTVQRHDIDNLPPMSLQVPNLIFESFKTKLGERVIMIIKHLFPSSKEDGTRVISFVNNDDLISFRHHVWKKRGKNIELTEIGPRFELQLYHIKLGAVNMKDAETEWVLRSYINTARKAKYL